LWAAGRASLTAESTTIRFISAATANVGALPSGTFVLHLHLALLHSTGFQLRPPPPATGASYSINSTGAPLNGVNPGHSRSTAALSNSSLGPGSASAAIPALSASALGPSLSAGSINPTAAAAAAAARHLLRSELPPVLKEPHAVLYPPGASSQALLMQGVCVGGTYGSQVHSLVSLLTVEPDQETGHLWGGGWLMQCTSLQVTSCTACHWLPCAFSQQSQHLPSPTCTSS
jgi:hypothetical protein